MPSPWWSAPPDDPPSELAQVGQRLLQLPLGLSEQHAALPVSDVRPQELEGHTEGEQPLLAPSCRSRSSRRRSSSPARTIRARDSRNSASCARSSACSRSFSKAKWAADPAASSSAG